MNQLSTLAIRPGDNFDEIVIDGQNLQETLKKYEVTIAGLSTGLCHKFVVEGKIMYLKRLLQNDSSKITENRVPVYVCAECGDVACGAVVCTVTFQDRTVTWSDFAWESGQDIAANNHKDAIPNLTFIFDRKAYEDVLHGLLEM